MSMSDESTRSLNQQTASEKKENAASEQNAAGQGLPGLAGFGQMPGYAPVTAQPPAPAAPESSDPPVAPADYREPEAPANMQGETHPQDLLDDQPGDQQALAHDQESHFDNPPSFLDPAVSKNSADESSVSNDLQSYIDEHHPSEPEAASPADAGGFDAGLGLNPDQAHHVDTDNDTGNDTGNTLQTFEAHYDQHPEIPLGVFDEPGEAQGDQPFFHEPGQQGDAEFLSGEPAADIAGPKERKGRKILMAASGLIGVLALGGALAFAYKIGGDSDIASTGKLPLIQADSRPVKVAPDKPGGKQFPHKNKKIYERLQGVDSQEAERLVPRQEDVVAAATAALGPAKAAVASAPQVQQSIAPAGEPRKVKTLTVRPDGTIEPAAPRQKVVKAPVSPDSGVGIAMSFPRPLSTPKATSPASSPSVKAPASAPPAVVAPRPVVITPPLASARKAPQQTTALQRAPVSAPPPVQKPQAPAPQRIAARPAPAPAASSNKYVVQVAARKSQADALATFADIQQKYPRLLSGYRPIIKKANLGSKGVWYRLNVGPVESRQVASSLCKSLKSAGMRSCIIRAQ